MKERFNENKKLIIINGLTLTAFIFVVGASIYQAEVTKDKLGKVKQKNENEEKEEILLPPIEATFIAPS